VLHHPFQRDRAPIYYEVESNVRPRKHFIRLLPPDEEFPYYIAPRAAQGQGGSEGRAIGPPGWPGAAWSDPDAGRGGLGFARRRTHRRRGVGLDGRTSRRDR